MSAGSEIKRILLGAEWDESAHAKYCAARNLTTATTALVLCALETLLAWRLLRTEFPPLSPVSFLVALIVIGFGAGCFLAYRCVRERFISSLFVLRGVVAFWTFFRPTEVRQCGHVVRIGLLGLWVAALIAAGTMLVERENGLTDARTVKASAGLRRRRRGI